MTTLQSDEVRIPRHAREALARHEPVVVLNRERPVFLIVHPDEAVPAAGRPRGRRLDDALGLLAGIPLPDSGFAEDLAAVRRSVGPVPADPWEAS